MQGDKSVTLQFESRAKYMGGQAVWRVQPDFARQQLCVALRIRGAKRKRFSISIILLFTTAYAFSAAAPRTAKLDCTFPVCTRLTINFGEEKNFLRSRLRVSGLCHKFFR
jgi:hypothetical protein